MRLRVRFGDAIDRTAAQTGVGAMAAKVESAPNWATAKAHGQTRLAAFAADAATVALEAAGLRR